MIDIHSHILPYVDDGSIDIEMSIDMARIYVNNGINKVIATPHYIEGAKNTSTEDVKIGIEELNKELVKAAIPLEVYSGNEIYVSPTIIEDIKYNRALTLNNTRYVLLELPMNDIPLFVEDMIYELLIKGYVPIIAHPERNINIIEDPNILYNYVLKGALAQINIRSLEGFYGSKIKHTAETLLIHDLVHFIGSDSHSNGRRSPDIEKPLKLLKSIVNKEYYEKLTIHNANLVLNNKTVPVKTPKIIKEKKHFLRGLATFFAKF